MIRDSLPKTEVSGCVQYILAHIPPLSAEDLAEALREDEMRYGMMSRSERWAFAAGFLSRGLKR